MKKLLSIIFSFATLVTLVSCENLSFGEKGSSSSGGPTICPNETPSGYILKAANPKDKLSFTQTQEEGFVEFLGKIDTFAAKLSDKIYHSKEKYKDMNYTVSPLSIYMALAMAIECSNSVTRQEMLSAVGVTYDEVAKYTTYLYSLRNAEYTYYNEETNSNELSAYEMLNNSIWINESYVENIKQGGVDSLVSNYHSDVFKAPFTKNNELANKLLSDYVKEKTKGLIDSNFNVSEDLIFALVNTYYLKEIWEENIDELPLSNTLYEFINSDNSKTETKLLEGRYVKGRVYETDTYTHFYTTTQHGYKLKFIVPKDNISVHDIFNEDVLKNVNNIEDYNAYDKENNEMHLTRSLFPKFEAEYDDDIKEVLIDEFNIKSLFSVEEKCDLSNMLQDIDVFCSGVIHKTKLKVDEVGIEGAAVTVMMFEAESAGPGEDPIKYVYHDYIVDKSFGFILTDSRDITLFSGVVNKI